MLKQGSGHIVSITTSLVDQPMVGMPPHSRRSPRWPERGDTVAGDGVSRSGVRVNRGLPRGNQDPMHPVETHSTLAGLHPSAGWAKFATSWMPSSISKMRGSSPARSFMSTASERGTLVNGISPCDDTEPDPQRRRNAYRPPYRLPREGSAPAANSVTPRKKAAIIRGVSEVLLDVPEQTA